jgi:hypothetical protein
VIEQFPCARPWEYQGIILPLGCWKAGLLKSYKSFKFGPDATTSIAPPYKLPVIGDLLSFTFFPLLMVFVNVIY